MTETIENFEALIKEKKIPLKRSELKNGQTLFNGNFRLTKTKVLPFGIVFDSKDAQSVDFQITYHKLAYVQDFSKKAAILELLNELNQVKAGYYSVILAGDGEVYLKLLSRTTNDVLAAYEMMVFGSTIAKVLIKEIEKILEPENAAE
ncbi:hypothetical protein [Desemzia sp. FAM 23991]|uniref:hypothetical protein n=1 Tax=unclassified Desemzia TaxID=2685243 RepID=UPI0038880F84